MPAQEQRACSKDDATTCNGVERRKSKNDPYRRDKKNSNEELGKSWSCCG